MMPKISIAEFTIAATTVGIFLLTRPHFGLFHHDGLFYILLALHAHDPGPLAHDPFLQFGTQRSFTTFPHVYGALIEWLSAVRAAMVVQILSGAIWFGSLVSIAHSWYNDKRAWWAVALVISLPFYYSSLSLEFAESIVSARLPAEALSLAAMAFSLRRHLIVAAICVALSAVIHPLMALATVSVLYFWLVQERRVAWWLVPAALVAAALVGVIGVPPFREFFHAVDPTWRTVLEFRNPYLFPTRWGLAAWSMALLPVIVLFAVALLDQSARLRRIAIAGAATVLLGVGSSLALGDWMNNVFVLQLQPWRVQWLGIVLALVAMPGLVTALWKHSECGRVAALLFGAASAANQTLGALILALAALVLVFFREQLTGHIPRAATWLAGIAACASLAVWMAGWILVNGKLGMYFFQSNIPAPIVLLKTPGILLALFAMATVLLQFRHGLIPAAALAGALLANGIWYWDRSPSSEHRLVNADHSLPQYLENLPYQTQILWPQQPGLVWRVLRRPSYVSHAQGAGLVFNRAAALTWKSRMQRTAPFRLGTLDPREAAWKEISGSGRIQPQHLLTTCELNTELDVIIANQHWPELDPIPFSPYDTEWMVNAYFCAHLRTPAATSDLNLGLHPR